MVAFQPPTRPHSANPHVLLNTSTFARPPSAASSHSRQTSTNMSTTRTMRKAKEADWEDAWDSGSDNEDRRSSSTKNSIDTGYRPLQASPTRSDTKPIPIKGSQDSPSPSSISASWASTSYQQYIPAPIARPPLTTAKTITEGAVPPLPGTAISQTNGTSGGSKLPPGGAWELVDPIDLVDVPASLPKVGKEAIRDSVEEILNDPLQLLSSLSISTSTPSTPISNPQPGSTFPFFSPNRTPGSKAYSSSATEASTSASLLKTPNGRPGIGRQRSVRTERRRERFAKVLKGRPEDSHGVDLAELKRLAWSGVPDEVRPIVWQLLLNYLPTPSQPRLTTLHRKRKEYSSLVEQYFGRGLGALDQQMWHQIEIDVPRTRPGVPLWSCLTAQRSLERILYVWAIRHPASGYVQGINDLVTPFFQVFLGAYIDTDPELFDVAHLEPAVLSAIEADSFWCLSKLLDGIQDNYISQQPGIQRLVKRMSELVKRIDAPLAAHFEEQGVEFMQFAFRWMNCLLMREISVKCTVRMWDTYLAEGTDAFSQFHLYVCSALLVKFSDRLREMDFQEMIIFLQCLPTHTWTDHEIELLLSEAYVLKTVWQGAENHFANIKASGGGFGMLGR